MSGLCSLVLLTSLYGVPSTETATTGTLAKVAPAPSTTGPGHDEQGWGQPGGPGQVRDISSIKKGQSIIDIVKVEF